MKQKLFIAFACLTALYAYSYLPMPGPLELNDTVDSQGFVTKRGAIMKTLLKTTELHLCVQSLMKFDGAKSIGNLSSYQAIMDKIANSTEESEELYEAIEALEYAIMYTYDNKIYIAGGYTSYVSIIFSGLRWRALNPFSYLNPWSWLGENHAEGTQLIYEFEQLSRIAEKHGSAYRLKATTMSYKHWRKVRAVTAVIATGVALWLIAARKI
jgi:hypothetical protein